MGQRFVDLANNVAIEQAIATTATGTTTIDGATVDTAGYEGVLAIIKFSTAASGNTLKAQQGAAANMSDAADLAGTSVGVGASDEIVWLQITRPVERYVRIQALRGTTTVIEWAVYILFGARNLPQSNKVAGTIHGEAHTTPAEGTA